MAILNVQLSKVKNYTRNTTASTTTKTTTTTKKVSYCPDSHPFAYLNGEYCCQSSYEKIDIAKDGDRCDGGAIGKDSSCCSTTYAKCTEAPCENSPGLTLISKNKIINRKAGIIFIS